MVSMICSKVAPMSSNFVHEAVKLIELREHSHPQDPYRHPDGSAQMLRANPHLRMHVSTHS
jgi:hypothetical protein